MHYQKKKKINQGLFLGCPGSADYKIKAVCIQEQAQSCWYFAAFCLKQHESNRIDETNLYIKQLKPL